MPTKISSNPLPKFRLYAGPKERIHVMSDTDVVIMDVGPLKEYGIRDGDMLLLQRVQGERGQPMAGRQLSSSAASQSSSGHYHCCIICSSICFPGW